MPRLPVISGDEFVAAAKGFGYSYVHTRGSHMILRNASGKHLSVPRKKELKRGLLRKLVRDADLTVEEFLRYL